MAGLGLVDRTAVVARSAGLDEFLSGHKPPPGRNAVSPLVVFDVRGNRGGDSIYAERLAHTLWGDQVIRANEPYRGDEICRVSALNRRFFADSLKEFNEKHEATEYVAPFTQLVKVMDAAQSRGIPLVTIHHPPPDRPNLTPTNLMKGTVVVLTDYVCNSACLYVLDLYLRLPNVIQAGVTTSADTIFMEVGTQTLPSGSAMVSFGHKAWVTRPRGSNVSYAPASAFTYVGDLGDDAAVRLWLAGLPLRCANSSTTMPSELIECNGEDGSSPHDPHPFTED
jgi:hypothetical protein